MSENKPVSGTREWASSSVNIALGCSHGCRYCYARATAVRFERVAADAWENEVVVEAWAARKFGKRSGTIMFPTQHDITPENVGASLAVLQRMLAAGNRVLIVSKPHPECIRLLCSNLENYRSQILFRFTIGSRSPQTLRFWEPGAPGPLERFRSLKRAFEAGFQTSVSMEPLLDTSETSIAGSVEVFAPYVTDAIWLGKANRLMERLSANGFNTPEYLKAAEDLLASQSDERILALYERLKANPKVKWKDSIKQVVGIERPVEAGLDR